ncbi:MAG: UDP-N-acetylmuramoylalanyl-D-glutamyl-2, 6-diaminopimelate--D-alanyl-D-alanine ligase, partial [Alphaproteobacteria bacterium]|nr:UDP-N-acetylmuramoylalanyl-D-glutamyl-2, 6-diaminopimelate--D-alanyl-D-alanine ligase [Alphaproteobacteria bacterium]
LCAANVNFAILVGPEMTPLAQRLEGKVGLAHVADADAATTRLQLELRAGDAVLVKGSNSVGLSRVVAAMTGGGK